MGARLDLTMEVDPMGVALIDLLQRSSSGDATEVAAVAVHWRSGGRAMAERWRSDGEAMAVIIAAGADRDGEEQTARVNLHCPDSAVGMDR